MSEEIFVYIEIIEQKEKEIQGLLDLYNKEKEKNASLQKEIKLMKSININDNYISKEKINDKIIELEKKRVLPEYNEQNMKISYKIEGLLELLEE